MPTSQTNEIDALRRAVEPVMAAIYPPAMREIVESCGAGLLSRHYASVEATAMLAVAQAREETLCDMPCYYSWVHADRTEECWDELLHVCPEDCTCGCPPCAARARRHRSSPMYAAKSD